MASIRIYVFVHLAEGPVPARLLVMSDDLRNQSVTLAYGRRYLERPDRVAVDPVSLPLHSAELPTEAASRRASGSLTNNRSDGMSTEA